MGGRFESEEERGFTALVEQVRSEVRVVAEGHSVLVRGQEELRDMIALLTTRVGFIENALGGQSREIQDIQSILGRNRP